MEGGREEGRDITRSSWLFHETVFLFHKHIWPMNVSKVDTSNEYNIVYDKL